MIRLKSNWGLNNALYEVTTGRTNPESSHIGCSPPATDCFDVFVVGEGQDLAISFDSIIEQNLNPQYETFKMQLENLFHLNDNQIDQILNYEVKLVKVPNDLLIDEGIKIYLAFKIEDIPSSDFEFDDLEIDKKIYALQLLW